MATYVSIAAAATALPLLHHRLPPFLAVNPSLRHRRKEGRLCCLSVDRDEKTLHASARAPLTAEAPPVNSDLRVVFAAGGSGGHIYPAIAIADELRSIDPGSRFLFLGSESGIESSAVPTAGYAFRPVPAVPLARPLLSPANLLVPFRLLAAIVSSWRHLRDFRPDVVFGTGGYVSAPVCLAAVVSGIDIVIQEQNSFPGIANRVLAPFAKKVFLAFNVCVKELPKEKAKCVVAGNPVRSSLLPGHVPRVAARARFFPDASEAQLQAAEVVLVVGGSAGAQPINVMVLNMYHRMLQRHRNRFLIWQTGEDGFSEMESLVRKHPRLVLTPFLHAMDLAYASADLVVSRAGAMSCTEIMNTGKPSILIPSPYVAEDHQTRNAYYMAEVAGSKVMVEDQLESSILDNTIDEILGDEQLMMQMSRKALSHARPYASKQIAQELVSLVRLSTKK